VASKSSSELAGCIEDALLCLHDFIGDCALVGVKVHSVPVHRLLCLFLSCGVISSRFDIHGLLLAAALLQFPVVLTIEGVGGFSQDLQSAVRDPLASVEVDKEADTLTLIYRLWIRSCRVEAVALPRMARVSCSPSQRYSVCNVLSHCNRWSSSSSTL